MSDKYVREIAKELKLIRQELQKVNKSLQSEIRLEGAVEPNVLDELRKEMKRSDRLAIE